MALMHQPLPGRGHGGGIHHRVAAEGGEFQGLAAELVDGAEVSAADLEDGVDARLVEGEAAAPRDGQAVLHVLAALGAAEQAQGGEVGHAAAHRFELVALEHLGQGSLAGEDEGEHEARVHVEIGEDAQDGQHFGAHVVRLVDEEDGAEPVVAVDGFKTLLQAPDQHGIGARGGEAGHRDLAADVPLGE